MICPVCKQRWAPLKKAEGYLDPTCRARGEVFESNEIRCCQDPDCLEIVDANIKSIDEGLGGISYDEMVEETKKELEEGKIKSRRNKWKKSF